MRLVLRQSFPLGRFHATPWRVNPFDDPFGEWPPSPWRFVRAVVARWYQWRRENSGVWDKVELDALVGALCDSAYRLHLPEQARRGSAMRQYHPVAFRWEPPDRFKGKGKNKKPVSQLRMYGTSLVQDNSWCVPPGESGDIWWFIEGERWTPELVEVFDRCLERMIYFGRAESLTRVRRADDSSVAPNCELLDGAGATAAVPVLVPRRDAGLADIERVTEDPLLARNVPEGARMMYACRPHRPPAREEPISLKLRPDCHLIQLAIGWAVPPEARAVVRLTARFRSAVLRELLLIKTDNPGKASWSAAPAWVRSAIADMVGKDAEGLPLRGHRHTEFLAWWTDSVPTRLLTRLLVWRQSRPFDEDEQRAILRAASREISWAAAGPDADAWKIKLVPLDAAVPPPPGFDGTSTATWESLTPYVPPRHALRRGKPRLPESLENQIRRELALRGTPEAGGVIVQEIEHSTWVAVHVPSREAAERPFLGDRRGYWLRLRFEQPVLGPLRLGHSSSFGLGLFAPIAQAALRPQHLADRPDGG